MRTMGTCENRFEKGQCKGISLLSFCSVLDSYWIGNALGIRNHKFFVLFHFYTCLSTFLSVVLLFLRFVQCSVDTASHEQEESQNDESEDPFLSAMDAQSPRCFNTIPIPRIILFVILSVILNLYTCYIFLQQWDTIESNQLKIVKVHAAMGRRDGERTDRDPVNEFFGGIHPYPTWHWFLPIQIWFPSQRKLESVMGYEFRPEWLGEVYNEDNHDQDLERGVENDVEED